ncbi:MAG: Xaa-Pro peptidase family protein, partial [Candidatus Omnitrophica bacterium]|nr:Xaa-Pro peptidase family protein [Candidatus Omnitrophota bacterium]
MDFEGRIEKTRQYLDKKNFDCLVVKSSSNIFYLTGLYGAEGFLCIDSKNITFFTGGIYYHYAIDKQKELKTRFGVEKIEKNNFYKFIRRFKKPVVLSSEISLQGLQGLKQKTKQNLKVIDDFIIRMRAIKEPEEIMKIKKALAIAKKVMETVRPLIKPGASELDIAGEILYQIRKLGGDKEAFQPIVASGINSSYPHHLPTRKKIDGNDVVVVDLGVCFGGYNSDITETFFVGRISAEAARIMGAIKEVHKKISLKLESNEKPCKMLHQSAVEVFKKHAIEKFFVHGLGHGVGIDVHELPVLNFSSKETIENSMVFTVEPGIYLPGKFGIRVEKMYFSATHTIVSSKNLSE